MLKYFFITPAFIFSLFLITGFGKNQQPQSGKGFAVVELFTSEGCSSCPAADAAVIDIAKQYKDNVFILGFHVDYWNYLGWKDVFSKADYSERQKQYASAFSLNSIYTPQIVVNGKTEFVGSDKNKLQQTIIQELNNNTTGTIELSAKENEEKKIVVNFKAANISNSIINIALVQSHAQSNIAKGENEGRQLHHINVVRDLKTIQPDQKEKTIYFTLPAGLTKKDCAVIAFAQSKTNMHIISASETAIQ